MRRISQNELEDILEKRVNGQLCDARDIELCDMNLRGFDLSYMDFTLGVFKNICFDEVNFSHSSIENALLAAVLEHAKLDGIIYNEETKWFKLHCPETGPFLGYKKCFNNRLV